MAGRNPTQLLDIRLVEEKKIDESYFQDYASVHELLDNAVADAAGDSEVEEDGMRLLPAAALDQVVEALNAWLFDRAEESVPQERLNYLLRCGYGHICAALRTQPDMSQEAAADAAYNELVSRGWDSAEYDGAKAEKCAAARDKAGRQADKAPTAGMPEIKIPNGSENRKAESVYKSGLNSASGKTTAAKKNKVAVKEERTMSNIEEPGTKPVAEPAKKAKAAKKPAAKKAVKKPAAKKPAAKKTAVKKVAEKKAPAKKPAAKKPAAKKTVAKKVATKKPAAKKAVKKAVAKKPAVKKAAAKKPAAKKPAAKKAAAKK